VLNNLVNPAVAITDKGMIQVFNKPAQALWGYSLTDVRLALMNSLCHIVIFFSRWLARTLRCSCRPTLPTSMMLICPTIWPRARLGSSVPSLIVIFSLPIDADLDFVTGTGRDVNILLKDGSVKTVHLSISERKDGEASIFTGVCSVSDAKHKK